MTDLELGLPKQFALPPISREEHLQWAKRRALEYIDDGDWPNAIYSMISDLGKHPGTEGSVRACFYASLAVKDTESARRWVEGWN